MTAIGRRAVRLEHLLTAPNASLRDLDEAVALTLEHDTLAALTVSPWLVKAARRKLGRARLRLGTVIGYGHGGQLLSVKAFEASKALEQGANQIDFVMNGGALVSGEEETVYNDMLGVVDMAHSALAVAGVIIEAETLPDELVRKACRRRRRDLAMRSTTPCARRMRCPPATRTCACLACCTTSANRAPREMVISSAMRRWAHRRSRRSFAASTFRASRSRAGGCWCAITCLPTAANGPMRPFAASSAASELRR